MGSPGRTRGQAPPPLRGRARVRAPSCYSSLAAALEGQAPAPASAQDQVSAARCPCPGLTGQDTQHGHLSLGPHCRDVSQASATVSTVQGGRCRGDGGGAWRGQPRPPPLEARVGREATRAEEGCGETLGVARGTGTRGRNFLRSVLRSRDLRLPQSVRARLGLLGTRSFRPMPALFGRRSLYAIDPPAPPRGTGGHPTPHPAGPAPHPTPGRDPRCTHCKKCTFRGRGWGGGETRSSPGGDSCPSLRPPAPWEGRTPPLKPTEVGGESEWFKCLIPTARPPLSSWNGKWPRAPSIPSHNPATSSRRPSLLCSPQS